MPRRVQEHNMPDMRDIRHVLVANELASYRESIVAVLRFSFPDLEVFEATAADLNREVLRVRPELVICSRVTSLVKERVPNWVELDLSDLLSIVDRSTIRTG
ncbi:MAG: hypothetical protein AVDCRST_MAG01-01-1558 [uncultured Rubrobacteraceae bacterium]|uniref:Response regulatory domain-containing protein n=1 Tax=uncultured Rubrobacteraceae bacterium TaxID=349277 RepID=A0A6J4PC56_9ACTN|nr:MAG: hypothetical protein AVDCRST_MAG01-01-1558 [uncultured Rubrobacteraceae bacterium]